MTKKQKMIIITWLGIVFAIVLMEIYEDWIQENWVHIRGPSFIVMMVFSVFYQKRQQASGKHSKDDLNEIINRYPWIKLYIVIYCSVAGTISFYVTKNRIDLSESIGVTE